MNPTRIERHDGFAKGNKRGLFSNDHYRSIDPGTRKVDGSISGSYEIKRRAFSDIEVRQLYIYISPNSRILLYAISSFFGGKEQKLNSRCLYKYDQSVGEASAFSRFPGSVNGIDLAAIFFKFAERARNLEGHSQHRS